MREADRTSTVAPEGRHATLPAWFRSGVAVAIEDIPCVAMEALRESCIQSCAGGSRLSALMALPPADQAKGAPRELLAALVDDRSGRTGLVRARVPAEGTIEALTPHLPQAHGFERELFEEDGIRPEGHPWLKPLRRHDGSPGGTSEVAAARDRFFRVEGAGVHEVAVGPVHAGIIEPGHFRFQCSGETVLHLEILLGYQHRGARSLLLRSHPNRRLAIAESIAGDTAIGHATAYCQAVESLSGVEPPLGAQAIRALGLELERLANHVGDLGALCNDIGYLPGASWLGRQRGEFLNLLLTISGNRFGRGLLRPGGVGFELPPALCQEVLARLVRIEAETARTAELVFDTESVSARFEETGVLTREAAEGLGLVGPVARGSGCDRDVRRDHPSGLYRFAHIPVASVASGDVMARAVIRWLEAQRSITFLREQLAEFRYQGRLADPAALRPHSIAVSMVEAWRGEIVHVAVTGPYGDLAGYEIVDPSFRNWHGLALAMRGNQISDFPLCNKSFNLSYAGHDL